MKLLLPDNLKNFLSEISNFYQIEKNWLIALLKFQKFPENFSELLLKGTPNYIENCLNEYYIAYLAGLFDLEADIYIEGSPSGGDYDLLVTPVIEMFNPAEPLREFIYENFKYVMFGESLKIYGEDVINFLGLISPYLVRLKSKTLVILFGKSVFKNEIILHLEHLKNLELSKEILKFINEDMYKDNYIEENYKNISYPFFTSRLLSFEKLPENFLNLSKIILFPDLMPRSLSYEEYIRSQAAQLRLGLDLFNSYYDAIIGYFWGYENLVYSREIYGENYLDPVPSRYKRYRYEVNSIYDNE